ncbi:MAG: tail fiber domain-containing protein [Bacteroidota bacterium]
MKKKLFNLKSKMLFCLILYITFCNLLFAATPNIINYQGRLRQDGQPVSGNKQMWFKIYDAPSGGNIIWSVANVPVSVSTGVFNYKLQLTEIDWAKSNTTYYLSVAIELETYELLPREQFTSVPYAFEANTLSGRTYDTFVTTSTNQTISGVKTFTSSVTITASDFSVTGSTFVVSSGKVGIGTTSPTTKFDVLDGSITVRGTNAGLQVVGGTVTASGFIGSGAGLTGVVASPPSNMVTTDTNQTVSGVKTITSSVTVTASAFSVGGSTFVVIAGNVGIGTTEPNYPLDVRSFSSEVLRVRNWAGEPMSAKIILEDSGGDQAKIGKDYTANFYISNSVNKDFVINKNGNVGIGTTGPGAKLEVKQAGSDTYAVKVSSNDGSGMMVVQSNGNVGIGTTSSSGILHVSTGTGTTSLFVSKEGASAGNVGIGTTWPTSMLDVAGAINTSANYRIAGSTVVAILPGESSLGIGVGAGQANTGTGNYNVFLGKDAGYSNTTGDHNSFLGHQAGYANTIGYGNSFVGEVAGYKNTGTGSENSFLGYFAGYNNTTGGENSFVGSYAGYANTTAWGNSFMGAYAGKNNTTGSQNSFVGYYAGSGSAVGSAGSRNTFMGYYAGCTNDTAWENSFLGAYAGKNNTTGDMNSYVGTATGYNNKTGSANTIFGNRAGGYGLIADNSFSSSTLMGYRAGYGLQTGSDNILIGFKAGYSITTGNRNIIIGYDQDASAIAASNELNIGGVLFGNLSAKTIGISTRTPQAALDIVSTGTASDIYAQIWRDGSGNIVSSMTSQGTLYATVANGDNLGNHTATQNLNMSDKDIVGVSTITVSSITTAAAGVTFSTNVFVMNGNVGIGTTNPTAKVSFGPLVDSAAINIYQSVSGSGHHLGIGAPTAFNYQFFGHSVSHFSFNSGGSLQADGINELMRIDANNGNVGVGTVSPGARLQVVGADSLNTSFAGNISGATGTGLVITNAGNVGIGDTAPTARLRVVGSGTVVPLIISTGTVAGSEVMRVTSSGNVGIGTTGPVEKLDIVGSLILSGTTSQSFIQIGGSGDTNTQNYLKIESDTVGTLATQRSPGAIVMEIPNEAGGSYNYLWFNQWNQLSTDISAPGSANSVGQWWIDSDDGSAYFGGNVGIGTAGPGAKLEVKQAGSETYAVKVSSNDGSGMMVVQSNGNVGIGTTGPGAKLEVSGGIKVTTATIVGVEGVNPLIISTGTSAGSEVMVVQSNGNVGIGTLAPGTHRLSVVGTAGLTTGTAWTSTSDRRWKDIQNELKGQSLDKILSLRPVSYTWNDLHNSQFGENPGLKYGFIAQEVKETFPEMISQDDKGYYWYNPSGMEAILTAAVQEQQDIIKVQRREIDEMKARLGRLEAQLNVGQ